MLTLDSSLSYDLVSISVKLLDQSTSIEKRLQHGDACILQEKIYFSRNHEQIMIILQF